MRKIYYIAQNTFLELIRDKVLYGLLTFSILIIAATYYISELSYGYRDRIIKDLGLVIITLLGSAISIFIGCTMLGKEIDKKTLLTLLSKPVSRTQIILGKYAGLSAILAISLLVMGGTLCIMIVCIGESLNLLLLVSMILIFVELSLIAALAIFYSTILSPTVSLFVTVCTYILGYFNDLLKHANETMPEGIQTSILYGLSFIFPNLNNFDISMQLANNMPIVWDFVFHSILYGLLYICCLLIAATLLFKYRSII